MFNPQRTLARILFLFSCLMAPELWATPTIWPDFIWAAQQANLSPGTGAQETLPQRMSQLIKQGKKPQAQAELAAALPALLLNPQQTTFTAVQPWIFAWDWITPVRVAQQAALANKQWDNAYWLACVLADYYLQELDLKSAHEALEQASLADGKSPAGEYAALLQGVILQKNKKHREAAKLYEKIPATSALYLNAQLNLATANIRQDWWADAITFVHNAQAKQGKRQTELSNHLLMTLGFIQLKAGFYRDAAAAFSAITQDSQYARRAALGLGLGLLEQKKYPQAANIFNHLINTTPSDLSTADGYFLAAVTAQNSSASTSAAAVIALYKNAISWYEAQLLQVAQVKNLTLNVRGEQEVARVKTAWQQLPIQSPHAQKLLERQLTFWREYTQAPAAFKAQLPTLQAQLEEELSQALAESLDENNQAINAYLSNCRYGLANAYDHKS